MQKLDLAVATLPYLDLCLITFPSTLNSVHMSESFFFQFSFFFSLIFVIYVLSGCPAFRMLSSSCSFGEFTSAFPLQATHSKSCCHIGSFTDLYMYVVFCECL